VRELADSAVQLLPWGVPVPAAVAHTRVCPHHGSGCAQLALAWLYSRKGGMQSAASTALYVAVTDATVPATHDTMGPSVDCLHRAFVPAAVALCCCATPWHLLSLLSAEPYVVQRRQGPQCSPHTVGSHTTAPATWGPIHSPQLQRWQPPVMASNCSSRCHSVDDALLGHQQQVAAEPLTTSLLTTGQAKERWVEVLPTRHHA
jgi:hypothetical protein